MPLSPDCERMVVSMTQYSVLGRLRLMVELDETGAAEALPFCAAAVEHLLPQLKPACGNDPRLDQAAAAIACCLLLQRGADGNSDDGLNGISSFKAGDITVTKQGADSKNWTARMAQAEQARRAAMEDIRELLKDHGFFAGITDFAPREKKKGGRKRGS